MLKGSSFSTEFHVQITANQVTELAHEECLDSEEVDIAVVTGLYDDIGAVLDRLGFEYTTINGVSGQQHVQFMRNPSELAKYDIIFFNCGMDDGWLNSQGEIGNNIADFVRNGGSVYTSDWAYYVVEASHPEAITFMGNDNQAGSAYVGEAGFVDAEVLDSTMAAALGSTSARINYDLASWAAPDKVGTARSLLRGSFQYFDWTSWSYGTEDGPLAARLDDGDGTILYTSFHNEQQTTFDMDVLLQEIILSL